jgi:dTDP-glucose 4,6-dehydratase
MHLAAESHVDRSIDGPAAFIDTNVTGTYTLLEAARAWWTKAGTPEGFRFHHISTDEVFGTLGETGLFTEETPYAPNSPYSASKAASDHLVRAWHETYGLPVVLTELLEQLRPLPLPREADPGGDPERARRQADPGLRQAARTCATGSMSRTTPTRSSSWWRRAVGESYNIGGNNERATSTSCGTICALLDELRPRRAASTG